MSELIRREDAISHILGDMITGEALAIIKAIGNELQAETLNRACERHAKIIRDIPAVDAVEAKHGRWIGDYPKAIYRIKRCSICVQLAPEGWYCFYCGARMDGGNNETD